MPSDAHPHTPGSELDRNSSSSTLVHAPAPTSNEPSSPVSPFSASFDPNGPAPQVQHHPIPQLYPITEVRTPSPAGSDASALWAHRLSASFGAIADQIAAASRALATVPDSGNAANSSADPRSNAVGSAEVAGLAVRLDIIERAQEKLGADLQQVQTQLARLQTGHGLEKSARSEKDRGEVTVVEVQGEGVSEFKTAAEIAIEELQKKVDGIVETIRMDQARLYARLHNATVTANKMLIKAPTTANGKAPANFPNTKGEFEHLTKERYEHILQSYNLSIQGDTNAKREALREFIGLTPPN